jgi:hypothetical protein
VLLFRALLVHHPESFSFSIFIPRHHPQSPLLQLEAGGDEVGEVLELLLAVAAQAAFEKAKAC